MSCRVQHCPSSVVFRNLEPALVISANTCDPQKAMCKQAPKWGAMSSTTVSNFLSCDAHAILNYHCNELKTPLSFLSLHRKWKQLTQHFVVTHQVILYLTENHEKTSKSNQLQSALRILHQNFVWTLLFPCACRLPMQQCESHTLLID